MTPHHLRPYSARPARPAAVAQQPASRRAPRGRVLAAGWCLVAAVVTATLLLTPEVAFAAAGTPTGPASVVVVMPGQVVEPAASLEAVLTNIRNWIMGIAGALTTVFLTIGGVRYIAASGDLGEVEKAKTAFRSAGYGFAIVVLAPVLVGVFSSIVGA